jgi:hypothetical protein
LDAFFTVDSELLAKTTEYCKNCLLIAYGLAQIRDRLVFAFDHVATVIATGRHILIDAVVTLYKLGKPQIPQFTVCLGTADIDAGYNFLNLTAALGAPGKRFVIDGLFHIKYLSQGAGCSTVFIFINGHFDSSTI